VPSNDPQFSDIHDLGDVSRHFPTEVEHFFKVYKQLEGKEVETQGWVGAAEAKKAIAGALQYYREKYPPQQI
jgi:inorganic pyrophosphatase